MKRTSPSWSNDRFDRATCGRRAGFAGSGLIAIAVLCSLGFDVRGTDSGRGDQVVLQLKNSSSRITVNCEILEYKGGDLTVRIGEKGPVNEYSASEIVEVRTPQTESHQRGLKLFAENRIEEAERSFEAALREESRSWVRREILAMLVRCALHRGNSAAAGSRFQTLVKSDPETPHFKLIPLQWAPRNLDNATRSEARSWITQSSDVARFLGASLLLDDPQYEQLAETELRSFSTHHDLRIRELAFAQRWRKRLKEGSVSVYELQRWKAHVEQMPAELRGGPYYLLGRGYRQRHDNEQAALALLWLPLVYDYDHQLAARACVEAAGALEKIGQIDEAANMYREAMTRFGETPYAQEAANALEELTSHGNSGLQQNRSSSGIASGGDEQRKAE